MLISNSRNGNNLRKRLGWHDFVTFSTATKLPRYTFCARNMMRRSFFSFKYKPQNIICEWLLFYLSHASLAKPSVVLPPTNDLSKWASFGLHTHLRYGQYFERLNIFHLIIAVVVPCPSIAPQRLIMTLCPWCLICANTDILSLWSLSQHSLLLLMDSGELGEKIRVGRTTENVIFTSSKFCVIDVIESMSVGKLGHSLL